MLEGRWHRSKMEEDDQRRWIHQGVADMDEDDTQWSRRLDHGSMINDGVVTLLL